MAPRPLPQPVRAGDLPGLLADLPATLDGDADLEVGAVAALHEAGPDSLTFCSERRPKAAGRRIAACAAGLVVCTPRAKAPDGRAVLRVDDPFLWFTRALRALFPEAPSAGVHPAAHVSPDATLAQGVEVGAGAVIEAGAVVGPRTRIGAHAVVHGATTLGADCRVGAGAHLGGEGLAVAYGADDRPHSFPHLGRLFIGDDVHLGAGAVVMRGMLQDTVLEDGVRVGNRVTIGHNCTVERSAWITAGAVLAGSCSVGPRAMIGANASIRNKVRVGARAQVGMGSVATRSVPDDALVFGVPAAPLPAAFRF